MRIALLVLLLAAAARQIGYEPEPGTRLQRTFTVEVDSELAGTTVTIDGQSVGEERLAGFKAVYHSRERIVVTDVFGAAGDGRPKSLVRAFEAVKRTDSMTTTTPEGEVQEGKTDCTSELSETSVRFTWNADARDYDVAFEQDDEDVASGALAGLREDMDLRRFLPPAGVEPGASWTVDTDALLELQRPGGVALDCEEEGEGALDDENLGDPVAAGEITATLIAIEPADGTRVARIALAIEAAVRRTGTATFHGTPLELAEVKQYEVAGELRWDVEGGHLHSLDLSGRRDQRLEERGVVTEGGREHDLVRVTAHTGDVRVAVATKRL